MVWIHGGGLEAGYGRLAVEGSVRNLVNRGVVVVGIQYRLGFLGITKRLKINKKCFRIFYYVH
jgi:carboxylesterase type B